MATNTPRIGYYARCIQERLECQDREAELLEEIMRRYVLQSRTLNGVTQGDFEKAILEAKSIIEDLQNTHKMPPGWLKFLAGEKSTIAC